MIAFSKKKGREGRARTLGLISGPCLEPQLKFQAGSAFLTEVTDERLDVAASNSTVFNARLIESESALDANSLQSLFGQHETVCPF